MTTPSPLTSRADEFQARASEPRSSAWVSANAGSGKTYVLVNRIIRLLLDDNEPQRILCLTYTRAAAAEMENRLFKRLSAWINLSDEELRSEISSLNARMQWSGDLRAARRLFTRALETPGGLKIQTIHAFCESVLQRFPIEAGVSPGFTILDDRSGSEWLAQVRQHVLTSASLNPDTARGKALGVVSAITRESGFEDVLKTLLHQRSELVTHWADREKGVHLRAGLRAALGLDVHDTLESICEETLSDQPVGLLREAHAALLQGSKRDLSSAERIQAFFEAGTQQEKWNCLIACFYNATRTGLYSPGFLMTDKTAQSYPGLREQLLEEQARVEGGEDKRRAFITYQASDALFTLASEILSAFQEEKKRRGQLDYTDLVTYTRDLLENVQSAWVMYRLDNGIDHVLVDEAQDTSPEQWQIFSELTDEFFSGAGARPDTQRTVFAVGDRKQSIYSFQGADPEEFDKQRDRVRQQSDAGQLPFEAVNLNVSFRSTQTVLDAVDHVFDENPLAGAGVAEEGEPWPDHQATRDDLPGLVELWPLIEPPEKPVIEPFAPVDAPPAAHPHIVLAQNIAKQVAGWCSTNKASPGDILILVRNRGILAEALVRALGENDIPVAGADRLKLSTHIAVMDLLALGQALTIAEDDYALACILKSPLVGLDGDGVSPPLPITDEHLVALAHGRKGTLWRALEEAGAPYSQAYGRLSAWRALAHSMRPFEFFSTVLSRDHGRRWFAKRLGADVNDPLDEFLRLALDYEATHAPSLSGFADWMAGDEATIKREMDQSTGEVRVMTVHGAKGLEANIVILPDTVSVPDQRKVDDVIPLQRSDGGLVLPIWKLRKDLRPNVVMACVDNVLIARTKEENRLLYVAMTRARNALYVCGAGDEDKLKPECWYAKVKSMMAVHGREIEGDDGSILLRMGEERDLAANAWVKSLAVPQEEDAPWFRTAAPAEPPEPRPLAPSRLDFDLAGATPQARLKEQVAASPLADFDAGQMVRGRLIHRLLQTLPDLETDARISACERFLATHAADLREEQRQGIQAEVVALLQSDDPDIRALFAQGGLAEVPLTGRIGVNGPTGAPIIISGIVDRLVVREGDILLADFKTNRDIPENSKDADKVYLRQLAAYGMALNEIYPGHTIKSFLVWTRSGHAMRIEQGVLATAFE
ncbi:MAG: double-strand break repair helicase AddA [Hyphomicrobiales bacterium]